MRISAYICFLVLLISCTESPADKLISLKESWVKVDTVLISKVRLEVRFEKALEYIQTHRSYWGYPVDDSCNTTQADTLRRQVQTFRIAPVPLLNSNIDRDISFTLDQLWACKVFNQPLYSLRSKESPNISHPSDESRMIINYSSETMNEVSSWKDANIEGLSLITTSILENLKSDISSSEVVLFEVPTGKTIRVHLPASYNNLTSEWDSLKYLPNQILFDTYAADNAIIFFNQNDQIEEVWWSGWIE